MRTLSLREKAWRILWWLVGFYVVLLAISILLGYGYQVTDEQIRIEMEKSRAQ